MRFFGSGPIESRFQATMNALASAIDETFNGDKKGPKRETGFILMVFPFTKPADHKGHRCNYVSNANRADVVTLLKEQLAYFEGQSDKHEGNA